MDQNAHGRRPNYQRGRRGQDRRGSERRTPPQQAQPQQDAPARDPREHVDIEQIMREIRSRISKGSGLDLTNQQIHELAARRLESILDPRTIKPALLEQLRRGATTADLPVATPPAALEVKDADIAPSFFQRLFAPFSAILAPILRAFKTQDAINREVVERETAANRRQAEWNALQYEVLQKVVTETSRVTIEMQSLSLRIESLAAKVDFNERRVRGLETAPPARQTSRPDPPPQREREPRDSRESREPRESRESREPREPRESREQREPREPREPMPAPAAPVAGGEVTPQSAAAPAGQEGPTDGTRRRRRRRRGRRSGGGQPGAPFAPVAGDGQAQTDNDLDAADSDSDVDIDEPTDDEPIVTSAPGATPFESSVPVPSTFVAPEPEPMRAGASTWSPSPPAAPEPAPAAEQPMPPRDEAAPPADAPPPAPAPGDQGPPDR
jgi:hypothetical protein